MSSIPDEIFKQIPKELEELVSGGAVSSIREQFFTFLDGADSAPFLFVAPEPTPGKHFPFNPFN